MMNGAVVDSRSGLQKTTADSSAKAEVIEVYNCTRKIVYLRSLFDKMEMSLEEPTVLFEDNSACISILDMTSNSTRSKHFEVKYFWVAEMAAAGMVSLVKCDTKLMLADIMTKALPARRHRFIEYWLQGLHALPDEVVAEWGYAVPMRAV
jgi:hypothetical protein